MSGQSYLADDPRLAEERRQQEAIDQERNSLLLSRQADPVVWLASGEPVAFLVGHFVHFIDFVGSFSLEDPTLMDRITRGELLALRETFTRKSSPVTRPLDLDENERRYDEWRRALHELEARHPI